MSKPVKQLLRKELIRRLAGVDSLAVVGFSGVDAVTTHQIRSRLIKKDIHLMVVKNSLARQAFKEIHLESANDLLEGPCALAYGSDSVVTIVRELLDIHKDTPNLVVKAAVLEGNPFGADQIEALSKYPNRAEAIGRAVTCVLSSGSRLAGCLIGPGSQIAALIEAVQEKREKAGETVEAAPPAAEATAASASPETASVEAAPAAPAEPSAPPATA